jgi:transposase
LVIVVVNYVLGVKDMTEKEARRFAVQLHLEGLSKVEIGRRTGKSRQWVHKWVKRYEASPSSEWESEASRRPRAVPSKTDAVTEQAVLDARDALASTKYAQKGAVGIQYELAGRGFSPIPPTSTIDRILKRNGRIPSGRRQASQKKTIPPSTSPRTRWTWSGLVTSRALRGCIAST